MSNISRRVFLGGLAGAAFATTQLARMQGVDAQSGEINLYSSRHYNTDKRLYDNFTQQTGIKVNLVEGEADALIERIKSEGKNSKADILITVDAGRLWRADQAGIFAPVSSKVLQQKIPSYLRHPKGHWFGFSKRIRVIMYNKSKIKPSQLSTYEDLANAKWRKEIVIRSSTNIYNQSFVAWLISVYGEKDAEKWCKGLVANFARNPEGNDRDQIKAVAAGIGDITLANTYYLAAFGQSKDPAEREIFEKVGVFFPNQKGRGAHVNISGGGLIKTAPNRQGAIKFLEYLVSPSAQDFFAQGNNEYPVVQGVKVDPTVASFGSYKSDITKVAAYGPNLAKAVKVMDRAGWK